MNLMVVVVILVLLAGLLALLKARSPSKGEFLSFDRKETLFSPAERSFSECLSKLWTADTGYWERFVLVISLNRRRGYGCQSSLLFGYTNRVSGLSVLQPYIT